MNKINFIQNSSDETYMEVKPNLELDEQNSTQNKNLIDNDQALERTGASPTPLIQSMLVDSLSTLRQKYEFLPFSQGVPDQIFLKNLINIYNGVKYLENNLKIPNETFFNEISVILPEQINKQKKTLFLDLDETLLHSQGRKQTNLNSKSKLRIQFRPFCLEFIETLSQYYEIYIFTASQDKYAQKITDYIDPNKQFIEGVITRKHCLQTRRGFYIKDLKVIKNRDLRKMLLIDNNVYSFGTTIDNGIPIFPWKGDENDKELKELMSYLIIASQENDLVEFNRRQLKIKELAMENFQTLKTLQENFELIQDES